MSYRQHYDGLHAFAARHISVDDARRLVDVSHTLKECTDKCRLVAHLERLARALPPDAIRAEIDEHDLLHLLEMRSLVDLVDVYRARAQGQLATHAICGAVADDLRLGASPDDTLHGHCALALAAVRGNADNVAHLLAAGADIATARAELINDIALAPSIRAAALALVISYPPRPSSSPKP